MAERFCPTCFANVRFPKNRVVGGVVAEQCVDPCHDEHVLTGGQGPLAQSFLRAAVKRWRGNTKAASLRLYGVAVPPTLQEP